MAFAVALPLCSWVIASCVSAAVGRGLEGDRKSKLPNEKRLSPSRGRHASYDASFNGSASLRPRSSLFIAGRRRGRPFSIQAQSISCSGTRNWKHPASKLRHSQLFGCSHSLEKLRTEMSSRLNAKRAARQQVGVAHNIAVAPPSKEGTNQSSRVALKRRVVVTGMGVVSSLGHDPVHFYDNLLAGNSGISQIENFDCSAFPTRIAGEIKNFDYEGYVHPRMAKRMDKYMWYLLTAGKKALSNSGLGEVPDLDKGKCGILIGSAMGGMQVFNDAIEALNQSYRKMNPFCIPFVITNMGSAMLAVDLQFMGPNYSISTACATGNYCILEAGRAISEGKADVMLAGGSDAAILPIGMGGFVACRALSKRNDQPHKASRPWDKERDGFVMGEGAGVLVLEELEHAKARGATIHAELLGGSFSCDAHHMTEPHPDGRGVLMAIEQALESSGVRREDVNYVNAHGTSTPLGDVQEYKALMRAFGNNPGLKVNSSKSMIGHLLGAAGAVEAVATVMAIKTGRVHPNLNLDNPDDYVDMSKMVGPTAEKLDIKVALSNSFGFGGHNSCILFGPYKAESANGHAL